MRSLALALSLLAGAAQAQPAPMFTREDRPAMCAAAEDHLRVLDDNEFEPVWRGDDGRGAGIVVFVNHEAFWIAVARTAEAPDRSCVIGQGQHFSYGPFGEARD